MCPPSCARSKWPLQVVQVQGRVFRAGGPQKVSFVDMLI